MRMASITKEEEFPSKILVYFANIDLKDCLRGYDHHSR